MSNHDDIFGVDWGEVGRGALGAGHITGKLLLNAFAGGAGVKPLEDLQQSKGLLPDWASRAPTMVANKPPRVAIIDKKGNKKILENIDKVTVHGGTRVDGDGIFGVDKPIRVELRTTSGTVTSPEASAIAVSGGVEAQQAQPQGGIGSVVRVTGDVMDDEMNDEINLEVVSEPDDDGVVDVFGDIEDEILGHSDTPGWVEISGDDDYFVGSDILGAPAGALTSGARTPAAANRAAMASMSRTASPSSKARAASQRPAPRTGGMSAGKLAAASKRVFPKGKAKNRVPAHNVAIKNAAKVVFNAKRAGAKLNAKLKQIKSKAATPTRVRGDLEILGEGWSEILGAALPKRPSVGKKPMTARQKAAQRNLERSRTKLAAAIKKAQPLGDKAIKKAKDLDVKVKAAPAIVNKLFAAPKAKPGIKGVTKVQGDLDILGEGCDEVFGAALEYDLLGEVGDFGVPDPRFGDEGAALPDAPVDAPTDGGSGWTPSDSTQCVLPTEVPIPSRSPLSKEDSMQTWDIAPPDAVIYDGVTYGYPSDTLGSYNVFHGHSDPPPAGTKYPDGFIFGQIGSAPPAWVVRDKQGIVRKDIGEGQVPNMEIYNKPTENMKKFWEPPASISTTQAVARNSIAQGWGPLIGSGRLHGLQYAMNQDVWFWQQEHAPSWYSAVVQADAEVKRLNKEARDAAQAECDALAAEDRIIKAEMERDRASREYELSMATSEEEVRSAIAANQAADQQTQFDAQQLQQQQVLEMQAGQAELEWQVRQAELDQQLQSQAMQYAQEHPEEVQQYAQDGGDQFVNEGFFEGDTTDRSSEEELLEEATDRPMDFEFIPQEGAEIEQNIPEEFDF